MIVEPVIYRTKDAVLPAYAAYNAHTAFRLARDWFKGELGKTFTLRAPVVVVSNRTWDEWRLQYPGDQGTNMWHDVINDIVAQKGWPIYAPTRTRAVLWPHKPPNVMGLGGMIGYEWAGYPGRPGSTMMADQMAWLAVGKTPEECQYMGWYPEGLPWWADHIFEVTGAIIHELIHAWADLPHTDTPENDPLFEWWTYPDFHLIEEQKVVLRGAL